MPYSSSITTLTASNFSEGVTMELDEPVLKVYSTFMNTPEAPRHMLDVEAGIPIPHDVFLENFAVAKELYSHEPGCAVNYQAIEEKVKLLEPFLMVTSSGPGLVAFFDGLRQQRHLWAVKFAKYGSYVIFAYVQHTRRHGQHLDTSELKAAGDEKIEMAILHDSLQFSQKKLQDIKNSHEFAQNVRILEVCIKKHKIHAQRKAHAQKRKEVVRMNKISKRKQAAVAKASLPTTQSTSADSAFNPDLPEFAQFMQASATSTTSTAIRNRETLPVMPNPAQFSRVPRADIDGSQYLPGGLTLPLASSATHSGTGTSSISNSSASKSPNMSNTSGTDSFIIAEPTSDADGFLDAMMPADMVHHGDLMNNSLDPDITSFTEEPWLSQLGANFEAGDPAQAIPFNGFEPDGEADKWLSEFLTNNAAQGAADASTEVHLTAPAPYPEPVNAGSPPLNQQTEEEDPDNLSLAEFAKAVEMGKYQDMMPFESPLDVFTADGWARSFAAGC